MGKVKKLFGLVLVGGIAAGGIYGTDYYLGPQIAKYEVNQDYQTELKYKEIKSKIVKAQEPLYFSSMKKTTDIFGRTKIIDAVYAQPNKAQSYVGESMEAYQDMYNYRKSIGTHYKDYQLNNSLRRKLEEASEILPRKDFVAFNDSDLENVIQGQIILDLAEKEADALVTKYAELAPHDKLDPLLMYQKAGYAASVVIPLLGALVVSKLTKGEKNARKTSVGDAGSAKQDPVEVGEQITE